MRGLGLTVLLCFSAVVGGAAVHCSRMDLDPVDRLDLPQAQEEAVRSCLDGAQRRAAFVEEFTARVRRTIPRTTGIRFKTSGELHDMLEVENDPTWCADGGRKLFDRF